MRIVQVAQHVSDLERASLFPAVEDIHRSIDELRSRGVSIGSEPQVIFTHEDETLGPVGTQEWQAFLRDSEDNLVALVEHRAPPVAQSPE